METAVGRRTDCRMSSGRATSYQVDLWVEPDAVGANDPPGNGAYVRRCSVKSNSSTVLDLARRSRSSCHNRHSLKGSVSDHEAPMKEQHRPSATFAPVPGPASSLSDHGCADLVLEVEATPDPHVVESRYQTFRAGQIATYRCDS